ncbi:MAG: DUF262 domain-containing protein [Gammaproteobacteria bacterium]|nr:DUF262 domain-containing protein [Gammaproteobacteria bacterium]
MEAKECKVRDILTENKKYVIPRYQRPYSWGNDNAEQLIDDIYQSFKSNEKEYFIGSMICINKGDNSFEVVDGQQRLTTLSLIVSQLSKAVKDKNPRLSEDLQMRVLPVDVYSNKTHEPRLKVRAKESALYEHFILQGKDQYRPDQPTDTESLFLENFVIIGKYLDNITKDELANIAKYILENVFIVFVQTDDIPSSFRLFNVLNNRGLPLSNGDLLKNRLFEAARENNNDAEQVDSSWAMIEDLVGVGDLDKFLTVHKLSEKKDRDRVLQKGFDSYVNSLEKDFDSNAVQMSNMLLNSAKNYTKLLEIDFQDQITHRQITSLSLLSNEEWIPPLLAFLNRISKTGNLTNKHFEEFLTCFEKVYMQGWLKKQVKSQREMVCYSALVAINTNLPLHKIIEHITAHADSAGLASALDANMYEPRPSQIKLVKAILLRLDLEKQDTSVIKTYTGRITIEHILPQKISCPYWRNRFKTEDHMRWLHKLGNLTLISGHKNSEAQNSDFDKKKSVYEKLNERSSFDITRDLCQIEEWNIDQLTMRHERMKQELMRIWSL